MTTGYSISRVDAKIKLLISYRTQLTGELQKGACDENLPLLPDDCWRHVISFLVEPHDVVHLSLVNCKLYTLAMEESVWKLLMTCHYHGKYATSADDNNTSAMEQFKHTFLLSGKQLKAFDSQAVVLCKLCHCVFWRDYGHPCTVSLRVSKQTSTELDEHRTMTHMSEGLSAHHLVEMYHC